MKTKLLQALVVGISLFALGARADTNPYHYNKPLSGYPTAVAAGTTTNFSAGRYGTAALKPDKTTLIKVSWKGTAAASTNAVTLTFIGVTDNDAADSTGVTAVTFANNGNGTNTVYYQTNVTTAMLPFLRLDQIVTASVTGITNLTVTVVTAD